MVKFHKLELAKKINWKQTRASVYHTKVKTNSNNNNNILHELKEIIFLHNYLIDNNQILINSQMPMQDDIENWTIKPETKFTKKMLDCEDKLEQKFNVCGKLLCISLSKKFTDGIKITEGSFSIVKFNDDTVKGVSALHIINENPFDEYDVYIFGSFEENISNHLSSDILIALGKIQTKNQEHIIAIRNFLTEENFYEFSITEGYLQRRKNFLVKLHKDKKESILLDPDYELQYQPSVDMVFLDLPDNLTEKINNGELNPLKISERNDPKLGYLVAYHSSNYLIQQASEEYCKTDFPEAFRMGRLLNWNKSIGQCVIETYTKNIITYLATTGKGSSGGCILDEDGDIIAMNFGNYRDKEEEGKSSEKLESYDFVSQEINKMNLILSKNANLSMNLKHEFIDYYFEKVGNDGLSSP